MVKKPKFIESSIALIIGVICLFFTLFVVFLMLFAAKICHNPTNKEGIKVIKIRLNRLDKKIIKEYKEIRYAI